MKKMLLRIVRRFRSDGLMILIVVVVVVVVAVAVVAIMTIVAVVMLLMVVVTFGCDAGQRVIVHVWHMLILWVVMPCFHSVLRRQGADKYVLICFVLWQAMLLKSTVNSVATSALRNRNCKPSCAKLVVHIRTQLQR